MTNSLYFAGGCVLIVLAAITVLGLVFLYYGVVIFALVQFVKWAWSFQW
jgi:hypothetical protein